MTVFIITFGYDSTRATRPVLTHGLGEGDEIVLVQPTGHEENKRANEAREDVRRMVTELQPKVDVNSLALNPEYFFGSIRRTVERIDTTDDDIVLVLGGGARDIYLPVAFAAFVCQSAIDTVLQFSDITGSVSELTIPDFIDPLGESVIETLRAVVNQEDGASLTLIANTLGAAKSTVARHVNELEEREFVRSERHGKAKVVFPTDQGRLAVDIDVL